MAELNFGLLTPPGSQSVGNAFVTGMDQAAAARAQENQNALSQYTLSKARREDEMQNQLYDAVRQPGFKLDIGTAMRFGASGLAAYKTQQEANKNAVDIAYTQARTGAIPGTIAKTDAETQKLRDEAKNKTIVEIAGFSDADSANAAIDARLLSKAIDQATADRLRQGLTPETFTDWKRATLLRMLEPAKQLEFAAPKPKQVNLQGRMIWIDENPNSPSYGKEVLPSRNIEVSPSVAVAAQKPNPVTGVIQNVLPQALGAQQRLLPQGGTVPPAPVMAPRDVSPPVIVPSAAPLPVTTQSGAAPANPKQELTRFETNEKIRGSEREAIGKLRVEEYKQLGDEANTARRTLPNLDTAEKILNSGFNTNWSTETQAAAAKVLAALGVPEAAKFATNAQVFLSQSRQATNDRMLAQKGVQTENDFKRLDEIGFRLGNTPEANRFLISVNRALNKQTIDKHAFFTQWENKNDTLKGAEQAWQDGAGGRSIFDRPELKQYATPAKTTPTDLPSAAAAEIARRKGTPR